MIALAALRTRTMSAISEYDPSDDSAPASGSIAAALFEATNWLEYGLLLVDAGGQVHFASAKARELLRSRQLSIQCGQLRAQSIGETVNLHRLIAAWARMDQRAEPRDLTAWCSVGRLLLQFAPLSAQPPVGFAVHGR